MSVSGNTRTLRKAVKAAGLQVESMNGNAVRVCDKDGRKIAGYSMADDRASVVGALRELRRLGYDVPEQP